jgi:hypothetical protein
MNLLILSGPSNPQYDPNPKYRGTRRSWVRHFDSLPEDHQYNKMFYWLLEEGGETGVVHDLVKAVALAEASNSYAQQKEFEVIEVTAGRDQPETSGEFLGFDLSQGFSNSLLWRGLKSPNLRGYDHRVGVLCNLLCEFFSPRLNQNGLFSEFETASFCLQAMTALQSFHDSLFEGGSLEEFRVVGVYLVSQPEPDALNNLNMATSIN